MDISQADVVLRLTAAVLVGLALGLDRDLSTKPIGVRTLALTALGAASVVVATLSVPGIAGNSDALSRVVQGHIQGLMAGIGFIGAGVILRSSETLKVKYMTTAATVWVAAALGIACGLGQWTVVGVGVTLSLLVIVLIKRVSDALDFDAE